MTEYTIEITTDEDQDRGRIMKVVTSSPRDAMSKVTKHLQNNEYIYQILRPVKGSKLPQPCYDFFNGFNIYEEGYHYF